MCLVTILWFSGRVTTGPSGLFVNNYHGDVSRPSAIIITIDIICVDCYNLIKTHGSVSCGQERHTTP